jgi:hypothetical protein
MATRTPHDDAAEEEEAEVESILDYRDTQWQAGKRWDYKIKWKGWIEPTWEPDTALVTAPRVVSDFWAKHGGMPVRKVNKRFPTRKGNTTRVNTRKASPNPHNHLLVVNV